MAAGRMRSFRPNYTRLHQSLIDESAETDQNLTMIFITGATGFIGRSLRKALIAQQLPHEAYRDDINDFNELRQQLTTATTVIHLAGGESTGQITQLARVDVEGTDTLIKALRYRQIKQLIYVSRFNATHNAVFPLLQAKGIAEQKIKQSGIPYTIVRSGTLFGKDDRFTNAIARRATWSWPFAWMPRSGQVAMQPFWVEDLVRCLIATSQRPDLIGRTVTIAGEERLQYHEIVTQVLHAANLSRIKIGTRPLLTRAYVSSTNWMWNRPNLNRFDLHRFTAPEVTDHDIVWREYGLRPARLNQHLSHLRTTKRSNSLRSS